MQFFQLIPGAPAPEFADPTLGGSLPLRAHRYCEPLVAATAAGWTVGAPADMALRWDGFGFEIDLGEGFEPLIGPLQLDAAVKDWHNNMPEHLRELFPPQPSAMMTPAPSTDRGLVQIWTGLIARTEPGVGLWVRPPVNRPLPRAYDMLEGVIETDWWFGQIVTALQFRTTEPVLFSRHQPFVQLVPYASVPRVEAHTSFGYESFGEAEWEALADVRRIAMNSEGGYKRASRARRKDQSHVV